MKPYTKKRLQSRKKRKNSRKRGGNLTKIARTASVAIKKIATEYAKNQGEKVFRDKPNILSQSLNINTKKNKTTNPSSYNVKHNVKRKVQHNKKGGFKTDVVDNLEDRDDDWIITKQ